MIIPVYFIPLIFTLMSKSYETATCCAYVKKSPTERRPTTFQLISLSLLADAAAGAAPAKSGAGAGLAGVKKDPPAAGAAAAAHGEGGHDARGTRGRGGDAREDQQWGAEPVMRTMLAKTT